jgi:glycerol-3-phosphate dehydrogenase
VRDRAAALAAGAGLPVPTVERLLHRHGDRTPDVLALAAADPGLAEPLPGAPDYLAAEVVHAVTAEGALHLDDVLTRRTRISIESPHRGVQSAPRVAELMRRELDWDDDRTADAARLGAPDVRAGIGSQGAEVPVVLPGRATSA